MDSSFRKKVYSIAKQIPKGKVATYGQIANLAGNPHAVRAVGLFMKNNPDQKTIPCHRVVGLGGKLIGYAFGGPEAKRKILFEEKVLFKGSCVDLKTSQWSV